MAKQDNLLAVQHPIVIGRIFNSREKSASGANKQLRGHNKKGTAGQNGKGVGVNNGIDREEFSMHYIKVDSSGGLLAKHKVRPLIKISQCILMTGSSLV